MARILRSIYTDDQAVTMWFDVDVNQTIVKGDLVQINATSRKLEAAAAASTTLVGIAEADITTGASVTAKDKIPVSLIRGQVFLIDFTGTTKTTLADTDRYTTLFDLGDKKTLNLDDTTGGMLKVLSYNNTKKTAEVVCATANLAI